jgi:hypothetical protein
LLKERVGEALGPVGDFADVAVAVLYPKIDLAGVFADCGTPLLFKLETVLAPETAPVMAILCETLARYVAYNIFPLANMSVSSPSPQMP